MTHRMAGRIVVPQRNGRNDHTGARRAASAQRAPAWLFGSGGRAGHTRTGESKEC